MQEFIKENIFRQIHFLCNYLKINVMVCKDKNESNYTPNINLFKQMIYKTGGAMV